MKNTYKISTGKSLSMAIEDIIRETVDGQNRDNLTMNASLEKKRQDQLSEEDVLDFDEEDDDKKSKSSTSKTVEDEKDKLKKGEISVDDVIGKLNTIRSGKSLKDEEIKSKLSEYIESLNKAERTALFAFLKGIAQLVTGEFEPESVMDPAEMPANVEMKKSSSVNKKTIKPVIVKVPAAPKEKKKSVEDSSGPVPIKPKK